MNSVMSFHLQYRLWIAELNNDINILRIFDDYLADISAKNKSEDAVTYVKNYKEEFAGLRKNIDDLRHDLHINKMELAALAKKPDTSIKLVAKNINHEEVAAKYKAFRKTFDKIKKDFQGFESKLIH